MLLGVEEVGGLQVGGEVLVLDVHAGRLALPSSVAFSPSTASVPSNSRKWALNVPERYATSKPTEEWTGSSCHVPVGAISVSVRRAHLLSSC